MGTGFSMPRHGLRSIHPWSMDHSQMLDTSFKTLVVWTPRWPFSALMVAFLTFVSSCSMAARSRSDSARFPRCGCTWSLTRSW